MDGKRLILSVFFFLLAKFAFGQSISYTYTDPCTGIQNTVTVSSQSGTVVMFYAGNYQSFTMAQLQAGGYEAWVASVNAASPPGSNPCAGNAGAVSGSTSASVGTNVTNTVTNVTGALSVLGGTTTTSSGGMDVGSSTGGGSSSGSSNSNDSGNDQGNDSGGSSDDGGGDSGSGSSGDSGTDDGGSGGGDSGSGSSSSGSGSGDTGGGSTGGSSGGGSSGSSSGGSGSGGGTSEGGQGTSGNQTDGGGDSEGGSLGEQSIESSSGGQSDSESEDSGGSGGGKKKKKGPAARKGALIASGDMVVVRNGSDYKQGGNDNLKLNAGITYANTNQTFAAGALLNYTTGQNEFALTGYGSLKIEESMLVGSNSFLYNVKQETWFNTGNFMYAFKQTSYMTVLFGTNFSYGQLGEESFSNWSAQVGVFTTFNGYKGVAINLMGIGMYSPYTFFYEGQWFKGGFLFVPLTSFDFSVTDTFKLNISTSTVMLQGQGILNFQLMTGTKMLL